MWLKEGDIMTNSEINKHVTIRYDSTGKRMDGPTTSEKVEHRVDVLDEGTIKTIPLYKKPIRKRNW